MSEALYITDPDGNGIEVYSDRPSADWRWAGGEVDMGTDPLDGNDLLKESDGEWSKLPAGTLMGHIHLHVADLRKTEEFYMQGLGFTVVNRYGGAPLLQPADITSHRIEHMEWRWRPSSEGKQCGAKLVYTCFCR